MANLDDLHIKPISEMSYDEAIEYLRELRLSRRIPVKKVKSKTTKNKIKQAKASKINAAQAANLLHILTGDK